MAEETIRPEFLKLYRVVRLGRRFRAQKWQRHCFIWSWFDLQWEHDGASGAYTLDSEAGARVLIRQRALQDQYRHDEKTRGWLPV